MKKILFITVGLLAAALWYFVVQDPAPVTSPEEHTHEVMKSKDEKNGEGSKGASRVRPKARQKSTDAVLSSDCSKKGVTTACKKAKGGKKSTSPTPLSKKPGSLEEGSYSRLPE